MESNDVFFSLHAVALTLVVLVQCLLYEVREEIVTCPLWLPGQHPTPPPATHTCCFTTEDAGTLRKDVLFTQHLLVGAKIIGEALCWAQGPPYAPSCHPPAPGLG